MRKKKVVKLFVILILIGALIGGVALYWVGPSKTQDALKVLPSGIDLEIKKFVYTEIGEHRVKWEVRAQSATYDKKQSLVLMNQVSIKLTTTEGKVYEMHADKGQMNTEKKNIEMRGHVVLVSDAGDRFSTDDLYYSDREKKIYTNAPVMMENNRMNITGKGLVLYLNRGEIDIPSMVKAKIHSMSVGLK